MNVILLPEARMEMFEAARHYEQRRANLGMRFLSAIERAIVDIEEHPTRWPIIGRHIRRRLLGYFPYGVLYRIGRGEIVVIAIMHLHRRPRYWTKRL
jgi:cytochrome P450